jgi:hypothetical protein
VRRGWVRQFREAPGAAICARCCFVAVALKFPLGEELRLDLANAVGVVLADRYRTDQILTLDQRDYRAIEPLTRGFSSFRILPADR